MKTTSLNDKENIRLSVGPTNVHVAFSAKGPYVSVYT